MERSGPDGPPPAAPLEGDAATLAIPLYAKARDFRSPRPILGDAKADEIVRSVSLRFEGMRTSGVPLLVVRAAQIDAWVRAFLAEHADAVVLHLGCGLDARILRVAPPPTVTWIDVDLPEVIALRRRFYAERAGYRMLAASLTEATWIDGVRPGSAVLAIADGVFEYLEPEAVRDLLARIMARYPRGEAIFDVMNSFALGQANERVQGAVGATLRWAVDDLASVDALLPGGRRTGVVRLVFARFLPWRYRLPFAIAVFAPRLRDAIRVLRYDFAGTPVDGAAAATA